MRTARGSSAVQIKTVYQGDRRYTRFLHCAGKGIRRYPSEFFPGQVLQAVGLRLNGGKAQGREWPPRCSGPGRRQRAAEGLCGGTVLRLAQATLNQQLPNPRWWAIRCILLMAMAQSSVQTYRFFLRIGKDQNGGFAPDSMAAEPWRQ